MDSALTTADVATARRASRTPDDLLRLAQQHAGRTGRQSEFAATVGWDKSHVTRLKQLGQLVLCANGAVDFAASLRRIADHADPARDAQRAAAARQRGGADDEADDDDDPDDTERDTGSKRYAASRATKEYWAAKTAEVEYQRLVGEIVDRADVERAVADVVTVFRQVVDNQPHRLADRLVGLELDQIRACLREDGERMLGELQRGFARRLAELAGAHAGEGAP